LSLEYGKTDVVFNLVLMYALNVVCVHLNLGMFF